VKVIVAGAGIGGLSAALSLHAAGIEAVVIDSTAMLRPLGVGINLMPHAVRELTELGLGGELEAPGGFERIEDVLSTAELAAFDQAYRSTTLPDMAALNSRPSLTVTSR
jgi:2-polyprenyl-6-methoxyphenol hydroxylase-like FAD-dependent oxidoreductase